MSARFRAGHDRIFEGKTLGVATREEDASMTFVAGYIPVRLDPSMPKDSFEIRTWSQVLRVVDGELRWVTIPPSAPPKTMRFPVRVR